MKMLSRRFVCFIFTFLWLFSFSSPINAYADIYQDLGIVIDTLQIEYWDHSTSPSSIVTSSVSSTIPAVKNLANVTTSNNRPNLNENSGDAIRFRVAEYLYLDGSKGDTVDLTIQLYSNSRYKALWGNITVSDNTGDVLYQTDSSSYYVNEVLNWNRNTANITLPQFTLKHNTQYIIYVIYINNWELVDSNGYSNTYMRFNGVQSIDTTDNNTGLLNSIIDWLRSIKEKLVDGFNDVKDGIVNKLTTVVTSIQGFFSDLSTNLTNWFADVGAWFINLRNKIQEFLTTLGDRISGFFNSLWTNISNWWNDIQVFWRGLFIPDDDFFVDYNQAWRQLLSDRFGALYQSGEVIVVLLQQVADGLDYSTQSNYFTFSFPTMSFSVEGFDIELVHGGFISFPDCLGDGADFFNGYIRIFINFGVNAIVILSFVYVVWNSFKRIIGEEVSDIV